MIASFHPSEFFDLSHSSSTELFEKSQNVWEIIPQLAIYLSHLFQSGKVKGNYAQDVYIEEGAEIDDTARILGPTIIKKNAKVSFNAYIHGNVIVEEHAVVGSFSETKNTLLMNTCKISHFNYVSDSILGNGVRFGVGAVVANKRVDRATIKLKINNERIDTNLTRFGAIIGDNSRIGANAVINPGTILGKKVLVYPTESVYGVHDHEEIIK
jgi:NDP-sugar pyrophosphorylase family protein